jgi:hypothetical protein
MCLEVQIQKKETTSIKAKLDALNKSIEKGEKKLYKLFKKSNDDNNSTSNKKIW